jgi:subtilisin family serine protease
MKKPVHLRKSCLLLCALLLSVAFADGAWGDQLRPRYAPEKPAKTILNDRHDRNNISVKFADDLDIGLGAAGYPVDRSGQALSSQEAVSLLGSIDSEGGRWFRATGADEETIDEMRTAAAQKLGREISDLNNYFVLSVPDNIKTEEWIDRLNGLSDVEIARPMYLPPPLPLPGDFQPLQGYLNPAADGIDATWAWPMDGGTGENVTICDVELNWYDNHQDLPDFPWLIPPGYTWGSWGYDTNHGTAVLGEMVSIDNGWGTTGAANGASAAVAPTYLNDAWVPYVAIEYATTQLSPGDVILIELQTWGPTGDMVPIEWELPNYESIVAAVAAGIHVVSAAGNGNMNLDDPIFNQGHAPFLPENNSGAVMVGAGAAPAAFGGSDVPRSRLWFSNYGSRVDVQGWGERVMTTGYGYYYNSEGMGYYYTDSFSGTSSASPIVASAAAIYESVMEARNGSVVDPAVLRQALKDTGTPQQAGTYPVSQNIGPLPNLRAALEQQQEIPTLSEWGMLILGLLLLAFGTVAVVRVRRAESSRAR